MATRLVGAEGNENRRELVVTKLEPGSSKEEWFENLVTLRGRLADSNRKKVGLYPPAQDRTGVTTRKMMECIFKGCEIECLVHVERKLESMKSRKKAETEAVVVKQ